MCVKWPSLDMSGTMSNQNDSLGDRMKFYENCAGADQRFMPLLPVVARLDGKTFSTFTKSLKKPHDERLTNLMVATTTYLVTETNARIGYTQSDEITLIWHSESFDSEIFFDGRLFKMISILAAKCSVFFNTNLPKFLPEKAGVMPVFDSRVWTVPNRMEAINALVWREQDATRNSIQSAGQANFSHNELHGVSCDQIQEMLFQHANINWNDYPVFFKRGTYVQRHTVARPFNAVELEKLPPKHAARANPSLVVERREIRSLEMPPITKVINQEAVVFEGADPLTAG